jgi:H+/Cl- antiporter ClcA
VDTAIVLVAVLGLIGVVLVCFFMVRSRPEPKSGITQIIESIAPLAPLLF